tara:strand:- start:7461 stop:8063 length:603 start_codon:yes stop_codon:yes gene_type:complete
MYKLYTDKVENFKCSIDLEGASLEDTKVRLVLESATLSLLYQGTVDGSGNCTIPISKLKNILKEGAEGTMKLEVIAEDTFFSPWEDNFKVATNKRVTVEVLSNSKQTIKESQVKVKVNYKEQDTIEQPATIKKSKIKESVASKKINHSTVVTRLLERKGINKANISENIEPVSTIIHNYSKKYKIQDSNKLLLNVLEKIN